MDKNKKFVLYSSLFIFIGFMCLFFYSGLLTTHLNVLTPYLQDTYGWDDLTITMPATVASFAAIIFYLVSGGLFIKYGVKKILVPSIILMAMGVVGIGFAGDNYTLFAISLFVVRLMTVPLQVGPFMLAANWFIKYRGRVLGGVTAGASLFSCIGVSGLTYLTSSMGIGFAYGLMGGMLLIMAVLTAVAVKDTPEEIGLYPDGLDTPPISEADDQKDTITVKKLLSEKRAWQLIITYGILNFIIVAMMAYMGIRFISLSTPQDIPNLFVSKGLLYLSIGSACAIPVSYLLGWIDDKIGSIKASLILNIMVFVGVFALAVMPVGGNTLLMAMWAFGVASMSGGIPTLHPCITSYVYGRKLFMAANKWIMAIQAIPMAFALAFMGYFNQAGNLTTAYYIMMGLLVISFITFLTMLNIPDANELDRDYGDKKAKNQESLKA